MTDAQRTEYERLVALQAERLERRIPPTEDDRVWFSQNQKSKNGRPRRYRVRQSVVSDHPLFQIGGVDPSNFLTIVCGGEWWFVAVPKEENVFGPFVNDDNYASFRIDDKIESDRLASNYGGGGGGGRMTSAYKQVGAKLVERGYSVVPIMPGSKSPGEISRGSWYPMRDWTRFALRLPTRFDLQIFNTWPDAGIRTRCWASIRSCRRHRH